MTAPDLVMRGSYDYGLVALSVIIAILASYAALDLAERVTSAQGKARLLWLNGGAIAMGFGIWSMHYIGMLALRLPIAVDYDWPTVLASLLSAILASAVALYVVSRQRMGHLRAVAGSMVMGAGIAAMHYIGMAAMRLAGECRFDASLVALSVALAIVISFVALWLAFLAREERKGGGVRKLASAAVMGAAIPVMHYTGMAAVGFVASSVAPDLSHAVSISRQGPAEITIVTTMLLGLVFLTSVFHRRYSAQASELESTEQRYRLLFERNPQPMWVYELESLAFLEVNHAAIEQYGYSRDEFLHMTIQDIRPAEDMPMLLEYVSQAAGFEKAVTWTHKKKSGVLIDVEITSDYFNWAGRPSRLVSARDITNRRRAEEKLSQLASIVASSDDAIVGNTLDGLIVSWNRGAEGIYGYSASEMIGQPISILLPPECPDEIAGILEKLGRGESIQQYETIRMRKDGQRINVSLTISPVKGASGKVVGASAIAQDISQRIKAASNLRRALEAAEAASQAKSMFLATMSHELRTPLNGILGMTGLVLDSDLTVEQRENLDLVLLSGESLLLIINDVLDFSRIEAGKLQLESIPFDLRESLGETMKPLGFRAHQKGLELICEVQPDVSEALLGDPGRIRQILINLIGNAIKFTEHGEISVTVEEQSQGPGTTCLRFAVKDTGVGVPTEKQGMIFEAFSQADGSMARKYGGTGLGLTICVRLVEMMGGRIWLESKPGEGSTFFFTIQLGVQNSRSARPAPLQPEQLRDLQTLIVDDNFTNRRLLHSMLSRWGMRPTAVDGGRAALQALETAKSAGHPFPLILLDGKMPEMDGFTVAEHIRKDPDTVRATIIMLTSAGHLGDAARCRELGISAYLVKPVRQRDLFDAMCNVLNGSPQKESVPLVTRHVLRETKHRSHALLAEDNAVNRTLAVRLLEKRGYTVSVAVNGRAALAAFEQEHFDFVLMDVQMPEMDGFEATAGIRAKEKSTGGHIPIIAMTAHSLKGDQERCLAAGMDGYVSKPIRTSELFATIEKLLGDAGEASMGDVVEKQEEPVIPGL